MSEEMKPLPCKLCGCAATPVTGWDGEILAWDTGEWKFAECRQCNFRTDFKTWQKDVHPAFLAATRTPLAEENKRLRERCKLAEEALYGAGIAVMPSRQGHYKRYAADRANSIILEVEAQLRALPALADTVAQPPSECKECGGSGRVNQWKTPQAYESKLCPNGCKPQPPSDGK